MKIKTELLEYLVRQCVVEVLDQIEEEAKDSKLKSSGIGKDDNKEPAKQKIPFQFTKGKKQKVNVKKLDESENPELSGAMAPPGDGQGTGDQPAVPEDEPQKPEQKPKEKPEEPVEPPPLVRGAVFINPKDKSDLDAKSLKTLRGQNDVSIERILHSFVVSKAGSRAKVSLGAKRLGREISRNPNIPVYFYLGKMDPESEEVFLMADKSLQVAKDSSVQPGELTGTPVLQPPNTSLNYTGMTDDEYSTHMNTRGQAKPRYGIDENSEAAKLIKKAVNKILNA